MTKVESAAERGRPHMPGYGIAQREEGLMSWDWLVERVEVSRNYWICSTREDGRPHAAPVWGVWVDGWLYFGSDRRSVKARNLTASPEVVVHLESGDEVVVIEGVVVEVRERATLARYADAYLEKYPPIRPDVDASNAVTFGVKPRVAFAWLEADFPTTATRWRFAHD